MIKIPHAAMTLFLDAEPLAFAYDTVNRNACVGTKDFEMSNAGSALVIAKPGQLRDGLHTLLQTISQIERVEQVDDGVSALVSIALCSPDIVLLDFDLPDNEALVTLLHIKIRWPSIRCVVLVEDENEQHEAQVSGAEAVLIKGVLATRLLTIIERLLAPFADPE